MTAGGPTFAVEGDDGPILALWLSQMDSRQYHQAEPYFSALSFILLNAYTSSWKM